VKWNTLHVRKAATYSDTETGHCMDTMHGIRVYLSIWVPWALSSLDHGQAGQDRSLVVTT